MIASLLSWIGASPWVRAALRYGVLALTILLFLLSIRRAGERDRPKPELDYIDRLLRRF